MSPQDKAPARFWSKVDQSGECWLWKPGARDGRYGSFSVNGVTVAAHRFAYFLAHGEIPKGFLVCHQCDNPLCVNPGHLFLGTNADNQRDKIAKGRGQFHRGERHHAAVLTDFQRRAAAAMVSDGQTQAEVARHFGVSPMTISRAVKAWA